MEPFEEFLDLERLGFLLDLEFLESSNLDKNAGSSLYKPNKVIKTPIIKIKSIKR